MWHPNARFPDKLRDAGKKEKINYFKSDFILHHKMIDSVYKTLKYDFFESCEQDIAIITGPTGVGKSCLSHLCISDLYKGYEGVNEMHVVTELPAVYVEAPVHSSGTFSWKDFYSRMMEALYEMEDLKVYGKPRNGVDGGGKRFNNRSRTEQEVRKDLEGRLRDLNTRYVVIDEIQHMFKYGGKKGDKNLDILKSIANMTGCRFIGFGTYEISFSLETSAQLARRTKNIEFPPYDISNEKSLKEFTAAYMGLLAHIPMQLNKDLGNSIDNIFVGCCGCVGILKLWCHRALSRAINSGSEELSIKYFKKTRLRSNELRLIAEEIREGKAFFDEPDDSEILEILGGSAIQSVEDKPIAAGKVRKRMPGKRKPVRDSID